MGNARRRALEAQRARRKRLVLVLAVIVLLAGSGAVYMFVFRDSTSTRSAEPSRNEAAAFAGEPTELVYADFAEAQDLHRLDLADDDDEIFGELPRSGDTEAAPGSTWLSIQTVAEDGDAFRPALFLYDAVSEEEIALGVGFDPIWSPDGSRVVFIAPEDPSTCGEEKCRGPRTVMVLDVADGDPEKLTESGEYSLLGWAGEYVVVLNEGVAGSTVVQTVGPDGATMDLPILPIEFKGASPDGRWIIQSGASGTGFLEMVDGRAQDEGPEITIPDGMTLDPAVWAHDSSRVAAALSNDVEVGIVTFSPAAPEPQEVTDGGVPSTGGFFWSPDNDAFVFQRFTGTELEAVHCPLADPTACEVLLAWTRGIALLRLE